MLQATLLDSQPVRSGPGEKAVSLPPPPPTGAECVEAIPLGSLTAVSQKQLFGVLDAQALHGAEQAAGQRAM